MYKNDSLSPKLIVTQREKERERERVDHRRQYKLRSHKLCCEIPQAMSNQLQLYKMRGDVDKNNDYS